MSYLYNFIGAILEYIDKGIYFLFHFHNAGLSIILLTIVVNGIMIPLTIKQTKFSKLSAKMNPEIQAIQKKYKGKKDTASQQKMQLETQQIYNKYGVNPMSGCLPLIITFPILISVYQVIRYAPTYAPDLANANNFLGLVINQTPTNAIKNLGFGSAWFYLLIPVLAVASQFYQNKLMTNTTPTSPDQPGAGSMKMMNTIMPFVSGFFCLTFDCSIGIYWIANSVFRIVQTLLVNRHLDKMDLDELMEKNKDKAMKKNKKSEEMQKKMQEISKQRTSNIASKASVNTEKSKSVINKDYKPGSIAGYANMIGSKKSSADVKKED